MVKSQNYTELKSSVQEIHSILKSLSSTMSLNNTDIAVIKTRLENVEKNLTKVTAKTDSNEKILVSLTTKISIFVSVGIFAATFLSQIFMRFIN